MKKYPDANIIRLGIGDTTEPIPHIVTSNMAEVTWFTHSFGFIFTCSIKLTRGDNMGGSGQTEPIRNQAFVFSFLDVYKY